MLKCTGSQLYLFLYSVPVGLEDVSKYPYLFAELITRGYSDDELIAIAGGNLLRVFRKVEAVSHLCNSITISLFLCVPICKLIMWLAVFVMV